jgi:beta-1,4-mannosyl-glycoprotein beta-1,4-N-acetylglucosaminyltransferase
MYDHVDKFILVESTVTYSNKPKELLFEKNKSLFSDYADKIIHVVVRDNPTEEDPWSREYYQRNCIVEGLENIPDDAVVMISDIDEIPDVSMLPPILSTGHKVVALHMKMFQYSFKYMQTTEPWIGTVITTRSDVMTRTPQFFRNHRWHFPIFQHCGWHLSSFGNGDNLSNKISTYSHCKDDKHASPQDYTKIVDNGLWTDGVTKLPLTPEHILKSIPDDIK